MAAFGDLIIVCAVGFALVAALSLMLAKTPATPGFARRAPTSGNPQLRQDPNARFLQDDAESSRLLRSRLLDHRQRQPGNGGVQRLGDRERRLGVGVGVITCLQRLRTKQPDLARRR